MPEDVIILGTELTSGPLDMNDEKLPADSVRIRDSYSHISYRRKKRAKREEFELGLEFQSFGDKNAVIRSQEYDGRSQALKVSIWKRHKESAICPVITLYINLMDRPWRDPCTLQERFKETDGRILRFMNYRMNVLDPFTLDEKIIRRMCPELKTVINCLRYSKDREMLAKILKNVPGGILSREAVHLLNVYLKLGLTIPKKMRSVRMCKAVREWKKMLVNEGVEKGIAKGRAEGRAEGEENVIQNMLRRNISPSQIHQMTGISLKRIKAIAEANLVMA